MADAPAGGTPAPPDALPSLVIPLLKGVLYQENDPALWSTLLELQARVRDYVAVLGLELRLDEAEGYAFLRSRPEAEDEPDTGPRPAAPRRATAALLSRQPDPGPAAQEARGARRGRRRYPPRALAGRDRGDGAGVPAREHQRGAGGRAYRHPFESHRGPWLSAAHESLAASAAAPGAQTTFEVRRILKAFVDAEWLAELDARLAAYRAELDGGEEADREQE